MLKISLNPGLNKTYRMLLLIKSRVYLSLMFSNLQKHAALCFNYAWTVFDTFLEYQRSFFLHFAFGHLVDRSRE